MRHKERHFSDRIGWLRAAVLGANDGIVSTASLLVGVAAAETLRESVIVAGVAGWVAGAMSMAAGEYVSVSSQADTESADLDRETSLAFLALLGGVSARTGGAPVAKGVARVTFWGALAMAATAGIGLLFGVAA